jgi:bla regulator protein blaR1
MWRAQQQSEPNMITWKTWAVVVTCILPLAFTVAARAQAPTQTAPSQAATAPDPKLIRQRLVDQRKPRQEVKIDPNLLDNYVGYYQLDPYRVYAVTRQGDELFVELTGQDSQQVFPESPQKFFYKEMPAQLSFDVDAHGHATGMVLHQGGFERPAPRIDEAQAKKLAAAFAQHIKDAQPMPGSDAALKRQLDGFARGQPNYDDMSEELAVETRAQIPRINRRFAAAGPLQSVSFVGVGSSGWDIYAAKFENGTTICRILMAPDGKVSGLLLQ